MLYYYNANSDSFVLFYWENGHSLSHFLCGLEFSIYPNINIYRQQYSYCNYKLEFIILVVYVFRYEIKLAYMLKISIQLQLQCNVFWIQEILYSWSQISIILVHYVCSLFKNYDDMLVIVLKSSLIIKLCWDVIYHSNHFLIIFLKLNLWNNYLFNQIF